MSDQSFGLVQVLFPDGLSRFYARPPFLGVYVEKLIIRPHGKTCWSRYNSAEISYLAEYEPRMPKREPLRGAKGNEEDGSET